MTPVPVLPQGAVAPRSSQVRITSPSANFRTTSPVRPSPSCSPMMRLRQRLSSCQTPTKRGITPKDLWQLDMQSPGREKTGLLIWLHGLGMSGAEFGEEFDKGIASRLTWLQFHYPEAPMQPITYRGGERLRAWFDLKEMPVAMGVEHPGLTDAAARVHAMLREAEKNGIPASRIILAGFSQGGVLSLQAGLTYEHAVAGICCFSSWLPGSLTQANLAAYKDIPVFMGHGAEDAMVPYDAGEKSAQTLKEKGMKNVFFTRYKSFKHWIVPEQFDQLEAFALREVPQFPKPILMPRKPARKWSKCSADSTEEGSARSGPSDEDQTTDDERRTGSSSVATLAPVPNLVLPVPAAGTSKLAQSPSRHRDSMPTVMTPSKPTDTMKGYVAVAACSSPPATHRVLQHSPSGGMETPLARSSFAARASMSLSYEKALAMSADGSLRLPPSAASPGSPGFLASPKGSYRLSGSVGSPSTPNFFTSLTSPTGLPNGARISSRSKRPCAASPKVSSRRTMRTPCFAAA